MIARLDPAKHAWMREPATRTVMAALNAGADDVARFVGGCVRNAIMGRPVDDIDIATSLRPEAVMARIEAAGLKAVPTGIDHGTITAIADGCPFEITTLRRDVETHGRRAVVAFSQDWAEDAARRDFRLNAIYCDTHGALFDPVDGIEDARAGRVIFIGQPSERIAEDHLRILRFYRFNAWYGAEIDAGGQAACADMADHLTTLSAERVWKELKKLLAAPDPTAALEAMQEGHVLTRLVPAALDFRLLLSLINMDRGKSRAPDPLLRLAAVVGRDETAMMELCVTMKASNAEKASAHALLAPLEALGAQGLRPGAGAAVLGAALYRLNPAIVAGRLRLAEAAGDGDADREIALADSYVRPVFPIGGRDLIAAGMKAGPGLGAELAQLEAAWVESGFTLDRKALLARAKGRVT
jgi:poly(A) polymerase